MQLDLFSPRDSSPRPVWSVRVGRSDVPYTLRRSKRTRRVWLKFRIGAGLEVVAPERTPLSEIDRILHSKSRWIEKNISLIGPCCPTADARALADGSELTLLGEPLKLRVRVSPGGPAAISRADGKIEARVPDNTAETLRGALKLWYKEAARRVIRERVEALRDGLKVGRVSVRDQKTRWGSCSSNGNLSFNWRVVMAPLYVIDYLVVHELTHVEFPDHSPRYWKRVESRLPDYRVGKAWLREKGPWLAL